MAILLIRHGKTKLAAKVSGQTNTPLTDEGQAQVKATAKTLASLPFTHIFSSDLDAPSASAKALASESGKPVTFHPQLRSWDLGDHVGKSNTIATPLIEDLIAHGEKDAPNGTSKNTWLDHLLPFTETLVNDPELHAVVTHQRSAKAILANAMHGNVDLKAWKSAPDLEPGDAMIVDDKGVHPVESD